MPTQRRALALLLAVLGLGPPAGCTDAGREPSELPEPPIAGLLLVTIDTLRADHVAAYGGPVPTPHLDGLAAEGALVEQAFTPTPSTGPAHASLFTGVHPWRHGVLDNAVPLGEGEPVLAGIARAHGFATAAFVSSYVLHPRFEFDRGFDHYVFTPTESFTFEGELLEDFYTHGEDTTREAMAWLTAQRGGSQTPFLLWVHYFDPHAPYQPPPGYALSPLAPVDLSHKSVPPETRDLEELAGEIRGYRGEVRYVDAQLGRLLERLRMLGLADDTAVIVTSDHGEGLGDHGHLRHGANLYDELVRIPLLVRGPGIPAGRRLQGTAQLEDLLPTALAWMGLPAPDGIDGVDLLPWLRGDAARSPREVALGRRRHYAGLPDLYYERRGPQKWIGTLGEPGLRFDLARDAAELAGAPAEGASPALRRVALAGAGVERAPDVDPEVRRALDALGYTDSAQQ